MALILVPIDRLVGNQSGVGITQVDKVELPISLPSVPAPQADHGGPHQPAGPRSLPKGSAPCAQGPGEEGDLKGLKQEVARLPRHHPLRVALQGEPDRMARVELVVKMREWAKYLGWKDSP